MRELQAPGAAVGVIRDGKVILARGYGVRQIGKTAPVTADTIFALGSITKSFTAVTVAAMVDEGKLDFDKPVRDYLPWFQMYDPVATSLITSRDLLTHRSGLPGTTSSGSAHRSRAPSWSGGFVTSSPTELSATFINTTI